MGAIKKGRYGYYIVEYVRLPEKTLAKEKASGAPSIREGFCNATKGDGWYCSKGPGHRGPHDYSGAVFVKKHPAKEVK